MNDGGPAFPRPPFTPGELHDQLGQSGFVATGHPGMSLRDWFASQERIDNNEEFGWPLLESLAGPRPSWGWDRNPMEWFEWSNRWQAKVRYARADAMLKARLEGGAR